MNFYNDNEPFVCQWLRNLIAAGHLPKGDVLGVPIQRIRHENLKHYTQCHFFAGIGGWPHALRLAGWPEDRPIWTASCPCQPFSVAGNRKGVEDERHLWPALFRLVQKCRPPIIVGEQVAGKDALGWLDGVFADLETEGYACAAADLCAAGVGAPHIRQRLYWMAYNGRTSGGNGTIHAAKTFHADSGSCSADRMANGGIKGLEGFCGRGNIKTSNRQKGRSDNSSTRSVPTSGIPHLLSGGCTQGDKEQSSNRDGCDNREFWTNSIGVRLDDETWRRIPTAVKSGVLGMNHGVSPLLGSPCSERFPLSLPAKGRVGRLKGYGNAIVPEVAAQFLRSVMDVLEDF